MIIFLLVLLFVAGVAALACWKNCVRRQCQHAIRREAWRKMEAFHAAKPDRTLLLDLATMRRPRV